MKKLIILLLFIPLVSLGQEKLSKKEIKLKKEAEESIKIIIRDVDYSQTFVVDGITHLRFSAISLWKNSLLENGFELGTYYDETVAKDANNREIKLKDKRTYSGRYVFTVSQSDITVKDLSSEKIVISARHNFEDYVYGKNFRFKYNFFIDNVIREMVNDRKN